MNRPLWESHASKKAGETLAEIFDLAPEVAGNRLGGQHKKAFFGEITHR
jgi:hypothetical protein